MLEGGAGGCIRKWGKKEPEEGLLVGMFAEVIRTLLSVAHVLGPPKPTCLFFLFVCF